MRETARHLYYLAIAGADPALAVCRCIEHAELPTPKAGGKTFVIAIGKAAPAMLAEALQHLSEPFTALGVTHHENPQLVAGAEILTAGHPVPDAKGYEAGQRIIAMLRRAGPDDQVIALISGGGSALVPAPVAPMTLEDKQTVNALLLESGLDIVNMNMVRQQLSDLKGGGFLRHAAPASVTALILSDVIGDDLRAVASGPTTEPIGTRAKASAMLRQHGIYDRLPDTAKSVLSTQDAEKFPFKADNHLIGSNATSLEAIRKGATGWDARIVTDQLIGDVENAAQLIFTAAKGSVVKEPTVLIFGGETTVKIKGNGRGGRNQELALRVARHATDQLKPTWVFLSGGTDGRDGPTDAAGGIVDGGTLARIKAGGLEIDAILANNDSFRALEASNDLLITEATGTNVADVQLILMMP